MKKNILTILTFCASVFLCFCIFIFLYFYIFTPFPAQAGVFEEIKKNLYGFEEGAQLPVGDDLLSIIIGIINVILTFLALLFIIMILYAGFLYLTAGGTPDKTKKALGIIKDSVIGVAIVILSGVFVNYILEELIEVIK